jgi:fibronectin-binding autotransporter adhesin
MRDRSFIRLLGQQKRSVFVGWLLTLVCLVSSSSLFAANGTADYFDVNSTTAGFGTPAGSYNIDGNYWSTDSSGVTAPGAMPNDRQWTFGSIGADFAGTTFTISANTSVPILGVLVNSTSANITLSGSQNEYLNGTQTWTVAAGSTLTEAFTFNAGAAMNFNSSALTLAGGGTFNFATPIGYNSGSGSGGMITQNGSGLVVNLSAAAQAGAPYGAGYTLTAGTLNFASAASADAFKDFTDNTKPFAINGGTVDNTSGGAITLTVGAGGYSLGGNFIVTGSSNLNFGTAPVVLTGTRQVTVGANTLTIGGIISGNTFGLTKAGAGSMILSGVNTYTGATTVSTGPLLVTGSLAAGSTVAVNSGGTLGGTGTVSSAITVSAGGTINPGVTSATAGRLTTAAVTFSAGSVFAVDLDGNNVSTEQILSSGIVNCATASLSVASVANSANAKVYTIISAGTRSNTFAGLADGATIVGGGRAFTVNYTATTVTLTDTTAYTIQTHTWTGAGSDSNMSTSANWDAAGVPNQGDAIAFINNSPARVNPTNDFTAGFRFGTISFAAGTAAITLTAGNACTFDGDITNSSSNVQTIALASTLTKNITITTNSGAVVSGLNESVTISGVLSGPGGITKAGATYGLRLSGANTYAGDTTVNAGVIMPRHATAWGNSASGTVYLNNGITVSDNDGQNRTLSNRVVVTGTVTIAIPFSNGWDFALAGVVSGTGGFSVTSDTSGRAFTLSGSNTFSGGIAVDDSGARIVMGTNNALGTGAFSTVSTQSGGGLECNTALTNVANAMSIASGKRLNIGGNNSSAVTLSGVISGAGSLYKQGTGTWALSGNNTYTGATTVSAGTLQIGNGGTTGSLSTSSTITVTSPGILAFNRTDTVTGGTDFKSGISGTGAVTQAGSGTLIFSGTNTYTGTTTVIAGTLQIGNGGTTGSLSTSSTITVTSPGILAFNRTDTVTGGTDFKSGISGTGALTQTGSGTLIISGANTYTGATTVSAGTLQIGNAGTTGSLSSSSAITNNATLTFNRTDAIAGGTNFSNTITGTGAVIQAGTGTVTFSGAASYTGTTTINAGTLVLSYVTSYASSTTTVNSPGILELTSTNGTVDNWRINTVLAGAGTINKTGSGWIQTFTNAHTFSGTFNIQVGTFGTSYTTSDWTGMTADFNISAGALLDARAQAITVGSLNGAGSVGTTFDVWPAAVNVGKGNKSGTFSGVVNGNGSSGTNNPANPNAFALSLTKIGSGTQILSGANTYTGATTISGGTLKVTATSYATPSFSIATGTVLEFNLSSNANYGTTTFSGAGTLRKSGSAAISWQAAAATFQLSSGALIDVVAGTFTGGSYANEVWTSNLSDLTVASGATFASDEANTMVNAINGAGTITSGYPGAGYVKFTYGVDNGSGTFSGVMADEFAPASFCKVGTGTQTLSGINTYTGGTTISAGTLIAPGAASLGTGGGVSVTGTLNLTGGANTNYTGINTLSGAGTVNITVGTGTQAVDCSAATDWSSFTGTMNIGVGASAGAGKFMIPKPVGSAATINVLTHGTIYTTWRVNNVTYNGTVVLNGGDTGESLGQLRLDVGSTWAGPVILAGTISGAGDGFIGNSTGQTSTISGVISETGGARNLSKIGAGTIILSATNTYTGATTVDAGTLLVNGSTHALSNVAVNSGGTLGGTGTVNGTITMAAGGTLAPGLSGVSIGTLFAKTTTMHASSIFSVDLSGASSADLLSAAGQTVTCAGTLTVANNAGAALGNTYTIISAGTVDTGRFIGLANNAVFAQGGRLYRITYTSTAVTLTDVAPVISSRETRDVNVAGNGKLDRIRLTFDQNLNGDVSGLTVTVAGYAVTGFDTATGDAAVIDVVITELGSADTGATPLVQITANTSLKDAAATRLVQVEGSGTAATDKAKPVLLSALYVDGGTNGVSGGDGDELVLTFSENVTSASMVVGDLTLPVSGDTLSTSTIANKSTATPTITVTLMGTPLLSPGNTYASGTLGAGKPSGIYLSTAANLRDQATAPNTGLVGTVAADAVDIGASPSASISIEWNDTNDTVNKIWTLSTAALSTSYVSDTYTVHNIGYSTVALATTSSNSTSATTTWTVQSAVGADQFTMKADASTPLDAVYELTLSTSATTLAPFVRSGTTQAFKLQLSTPTTSSTAAAQAITVTITASQY